VGFAGLIDPARNAHRQAAFACCQIIWGTSMNGIIYLVGLVVVVMAILSFVGLR
jgi:hypothetical protein